MPGSIRITSGEDAGRLIEISGELVLGRSQEGPGRVPDGEISRTHARVYVESDGGLAIEDLGSTNGTFVRGERITGPRPLSPGDTLRLGQTTLEVEWPSPAAAELEDEAEPDEVEFEVAEPEEEPAEPEPEPEAAPPPAAPPPEPEAAPPPAAPPPGPAIEPPMAPVPGAVHPQPPTAAGASAPPSRGTAPRLLVAVLVGVFLLAAAGIAAVLLLTGDDDEPEKEQASNEVRVEGPPELQRAARAAGCTSQNHPPEGRQHVRGIVKYKTNPPNSGAHDPQAAADGAYDIAPPTTQLVHALEHGRIVMWHKPGDRKGRELLRKVGDEDGAKMILVPNATGMPYAVAATAWGHLLGCPKLNDEVPEAVRTFRDAYRGRGPEFVP